MPPAKRPAAESDLRSQGSIATEKQIAAAAHARRSKVNGASAQQNLGSGLKELALTGTEASGVIAPGQQGQGVSSPWSPT